MNEEKKLYIYSYGTDPNKISVDETSKHWNLDIKIDSKKYFSDWKNKYKIKIFLKYSLYIQYKKQNLLNLVFYNSLVCVQLLKIFPLLLVVSEFVW